MVPSTTTELSSYDTILSLIKTNDSKLCHVHLSCMNLDPTRFLQLIDVLKDNTIVTSIDLHGNQIDDDCLIALVEQVLKPNKTSLREINLSDNNIHDNGIIALADCLQYYNTTIQILYLHYNPTTTYGCKALAEALRYNTTIQQLYILWFPDSAKVLLDTLHNDNDTLYNVQLLYNYNIPKQYLYNIQQLTYDNKHQNRSAVRKVQRRRASTLTTLQSKWVPALW
jgi:Leucine Rich repeat